MAAIRVVTGHEHVLRAVFAPIEDRARERVAIAVILVDAGHARSRAVLCRRVHPGGIGDVDEDGRVTSGVAKEHVLAVVGPAVLAGSDVEVREAVVVDVER